MERESLPAGLAVGRRSPCRAGVYFRTFGLKSQEEEMLLAACNRQWLAAGTVFSGARSRGIIAGNGGGGEARWARVDKIGRGG
jgi:hypothetical protein